MAKPRKNKVRADVTKVTTELREKVQSKMDVGKFFAGFITLLIGILLSECQPLDIWSKVGIILLISSLGFCVAAVFCYDRLLMPREYWTALPAKEKTDERFQDHLQNEMVRSWSYLFVPAVICFGAGFLLILVNALKLAPSDAPTDDKGWLAALLGIAVLAPIVLGKTMGPKIYGSATIRDER